MEHHGGGVERKRVIRFDARVVPALTLGIVHDKHVVGVVVAEAQMLLIGLVLRMLGFRDADVKHD